MGQSWTVCATEGIEDTPNLSTADYSRLQLNGLQIGQPGTAPLRYGNRPRHNRKDSPDYAPPDNPCPTCGQPLAPEPPCTTTRGDKTFTTQISRCPNARRRPLKHYGREVVHAACQPQITETEITEMATRPGPMIARSQEWIDSVNERRAELNLTLRELADAAGIHKSVMQRAISRDYGASDATVFAVDRALLVATAEQDSKALDAEYRESQSLVSEHLKDVVEQTLTPNPDDSSTWQHEWTGKPITEPSHTIAALQDSVATLAGHQDRFWCDHNEGMKRITALEAGLSAIDKRLGHAINGSEGVVKSFTDRLNTCEARIEDWARDADGVETTISNLKDAHESLTDACTLRIGNLEHQSRVHHNTLTKMEEAYRNTCSVGVLADKMANLEHLPDRLTAAEHRLSDTERQIGYAEKRITINDGEINNLAKSVEHLSQDATAHEEIIKGIEDQIAILATAQQESFYQTANTEAIRRHEKGIHDLDAAITNIVTNANSSDHDNAIAFLELAVQTLTQRLAALEARDTEKFAMRVIECLAGRLG